MANTTGKKFGGRQKGTGNIATKPIKDKVVQLIEGYSIDAMQRDLNDIEKPEDRLKILMGLMEFVIPKIARTELTGKEGDDISFKVSLNLD